MYSEDKGDVTRQNAKAMQQNKTKQDNKVQQQEGLVIKQHNNKVQH
jgi:hypothetical protein